MNNEGTISFNAGDNPKSKESVANKSLGIPTAAEFARQYSKELDSGESFVWAEVLLNFAKLHVKAALEAAYNNAEMKECSKDDEQICWTADDYGDAWVLDKNSIINSYPLENIK